MTLDQLISLYPQAVSDLLMDIRGCLKARFPALVEEVDLSSRVVFFRVGSGMTGIVFSLIPSQKGVKLGFYRGIDLDDPSRLLEGSGKVHKYIPIRDVAQLDSLAFLQIMDAAMAQADLRQGRKR